MQKRLSVGGGAAERVNLSVNGKPLDVSSFTSQGGTGMLFRDLRGGGGSSPKGLKFLIFLLISAQNMVLQ